MKQMNFNYDPFIYDVFDVEFQKGVLGKSYIDQPSKIEDYALLSNCKKILEKDIGDIYYHFRTILRKETIEIEGTWE